MPPRTDQVNQQSPESSAPATVAPSEPQTVDLGSAKPTPKAPKTVRVRVLRPILVDRHEDKHGTVQGTIVNPGTETFLTEADAKLFCDTKFQGHFEHVGMREGEAPKHHACVRAVRL